MFDINTFISRQVLNSNQKQAVGEEEEEEKEEEEEEEEEGHFLYRELIDRGSYSVDVDRNFD